MPIPADIFQIWAALFGNANPPVPAQNLYAANFNTSGLIYESFVDNITANAGGGQSGAYKITSEVSRITTVANSGDSIALPPALPGLTLMVINHGSKPMQVYGNAAAGDVINDVATATGIAQMQGSNTIYTCTTLGKWYSNGTAEGYAGSFLTQSSIDNITAHAGGGQGSATPLTAMMNRITTVANSGDSVILPASVSGMSLTIINATATNAMNLFPNGTDQINALGASAAFSVAAGKTVEAYCVTAGQWHTILSA
jgi:hypothetical protein